jgi:uncharacterized protein (TIGR03435 family)
VLAVPSTPLASAQETTARSEPPQFEVASIKVIDPDAPLTMGVRVYPGGRVEISGFSLKGLIATAFDVVFWQVSGGEEWTSKDEYLVVAKPPEALQSRIRTFRYTLFDIDDPLLRQMLEALVVDRFQLKFHRESRNGDIYLLERNQKPLALKPAKTSEEVSERDSFGSIGYAGGKWNIFHSTMPQLAKFASGVILRAPVLDRTQLTGAFDYRQRQPDLEPQYSGNQTDSFKAFLAQAGLRCERSTGAIEMFVIDHASRPDLN